MKAPESTLSVQDQDRELRKLLENEPHFKKKYAEYFRAMDPKIIQIGPEEFY